MIQKTEWMTNTVEASKNIMQAIQIPPQCFPILFMTTFIFF